MIGLIAKKPIGVLHLLDDESNFPKATDASFLEKCHYNHALNELYYRPRMSSMEFGIKHYAGQVRLHKICVTFTSYKVERDFVGLLGVVQCGRFP